MLTLIEQPEGLLEFFNLIFTELHFETLTDNPAKNLNLYSELFAFCTTRICLQTFSKDLIHKCLSLCISMRLNHWILLFFTFFLHHVFIIFSSSSKGFFTIMKLSFSRLPEQIRPQKWRIDLRSKEKTTHANVILTFNVTLTLHKKWKTKRPVHLKTTRNNDSHFIWII